MSRQARFNARRRNRRYLWRQLETLEARRVLAGFNLTADVADGEAGSLRDAVIQSNSNGEDDVISLAPGTYRLTIQGHDQAAALGDLDLTEINTEIVIRGTDAETTIIDASELGDRAIEILGRVNVVIEGVTIQGGSGVGAGGAINALTEQNPLDIDPNGVARLVVRHSIFRQNHATYEGGAINNWGPLLVEDSQFIDNRADYEGGGIEHNGGGHATITRSVFSGNHSNYEGAGISVGTWTVGTTSMTIDSSTISDNQARYAGGGIDVEQAKLTITNTTLSDNRASHEGGEINNWRGTVEMDHTTVFHRGGSRSSLNGSIRASNSLIAGNNALNSSFRSRGNNLVHSTIGEFRAQETDIIGVDPMLGPLADNGGPTPTHALRAGSPAMDAAAGELAVDQRGAIRNTDGDGNGVSGNDIGAFEAATLTSYLVNSERDAVDLNPGDGLIDTGTEGEVTLRAAVMEASAGIDRVRIQIPEGTFALSLGSFDEHIPNEDSGAEDDLDVYGEIFFEGAGQGRSVIDAASNNGILEVHESAQVNLLDLTLINGAGYGAVVNHGQLNVKQTTIEESHGGLSDTGGGITNRGSLTLTESLVQSNNTGATGVGGGIANFGHLTVTQSTVYGNSTGAAGVGGGIFTQDGSVEITNSTISNNSSGAVGAGGGLGIASGVVTVRSSTIFQNQSSAAGVGGGIAVLDGELTIVNTIVAMNDSGQIFGGFGDGGFNFIGDQDPMLGDLADNGGPTPTHLPLLGSPVIDQGISLELPTDQRGFDRTFDDLRVDYVPTFEEHPQEDLLDDFAEDWFFGSGDQTDIGAVEATYELLQPLARDDSYATLGVLNSQLLPVRRDRSVLNNDIGKSQLSAAIATGPENGRVSLASDGTFIYVPNPGFSGLDSFTYFAVDGETSSEAAAVTIQVTTASSVAGQSYLDFDDDGQVDPTDIGLWQTPISLFGTDSNGEAVFRQTLTNAQGEYRFDDLTPGTYTLRKTSPPGLSDGKDTLGSLGGDDSVNDQFTIALIAGVDGTGYNFGQTWNGDGELLEVIGNLGNRVMGDSNGDGRFDSSDLVHVFQAGHYEDTFANNSGFGQGDWNGDGDFNTSDLVYVFQHGNYAAESLEADFAAAIDFIFDQHDLKRPLL